jgi:hypothetical protein
MPARDLSPAEKLALTAGAVVQVYVQRADEKGIQVGIKPSTGPASRTVAKGSASSSAGTKKSAAKGHSPEPAAPPLASQPPGLLLNNLKTGLQLKGIVASRNSYAAFIQANVYRKSKGGAFSEVLGMLHKNDAHESKSPLDLEKGSEVTVYVKEVMKNSG